MRPENATRFAGYIRLVNEGAVRLEVVQTSGTSQISPEQFPETDAARDAFRAEGRQRFAYRFAGADFTLRLQADQILPELVVSELLAYRVGESELTLDAELELDIREAPLRELLIDVPRGFAVARLNAADLSDYFLSEPAGASNAELRLVYSQPVSGRRVLQLRRDVQHEKPVFYAELTQLYVPMAGVIEGAHHVAIRAAQGDLGELVLNVPPGATITDVGASGSLVSLWRFDPDTRKLRVT